MIGDWNVTKAWFSFCHASITNHQFSRTISTMAENREIKLTLLPPHPCPYLPGGRRVSGVFIGADAGGDVSWVAGCGVSAERAVGVSAGLCGCRECRAMRISVERFSIEIAAAGLEAESGFERDDCEGAGDGGEVYAVSARMCGSGMGKKRMRRRRHLCLFYMSRRWGRSRWNIGMGRGGC